jgi:hypothetical protein
MCVRIGGREVLGISVDEVCVGRMKLQARDSLASFDVCVKEVNWFVASR